MKEKKTTALASLIIIGAMAFASCERQCRCYHYNGSIVTYTEEELEAMDENCLTMQDFNMGLTYSYCEWKY